MFLFSKIILEKQVHGSWIDYRLLFLRSRTVCSLWWLRCWSEIIKMPFNELTPLTNLFEIIVLTICIYENRDIQIDKLFQWMKIVQYEHMWLICICPIFQITSKYQEISKTRFKFQALLEIWIIDRYFSSFLPKLWFVIKCMLDYKIVYKKRFIKSDAPKNQRSRKGLTTDGQYFLFYFKEEDISLCFIRRETTLLLSSLSSRK